MVLKKVLIKLISKGEMMGGSEKPAVDNSSKLQQNGSQGRGDTKKKLKKVRSVRVADLHGVKKASKPKAMDEIPNYMKHTSCYDAKKEKKTVTMQSVAIALAKSSSLKLWKSSTKKKNNTDHKTDSSSATKSVDLKQHHDVSDVKACPYTFCSIHGHKHASLPTLKRLLSRKRQPLKAQNSIKLRVFSKRKKNGNKEEIELIDDVVNELFSELQDSSVSDHEEDSAACSSELSMEEDQIINQFLAFIENGCQEERKATWPSFMQSKCANLSKTASHRASFPNQKDVSYDNGFLEGQYSIENDATVHGAHQKSTAKEKCSKLRRQITKFRASLKRSEQVNLKHQAVDERKAAEEWMVDYALRKALRKMASGRHAKVPLLVSAFEAVMPQKCETKQGN